MKGYVYIATSVDGFIAGLDGDVSFLDEYHQNATEDDDMGFVAFLQSVDVLIMGRNSFEKVVSFGEDMWPYGDTPVIVWTRDKNYQQKVPSHLSENVECSSLSPTELVKEQEKKGRKRGYIDGGFTVQSFLKEGLVHDIKLTRAPIVLGSGIKLFSDEGKQVKLHHISTQTYSSGLVTSHYRLNEEDEEEEDDDDES